MLAWGITDGSAGMAAQVRALAIALGLQPVMKKVGVRKPFSYLPNLFYASPLARLVVPYGIASGSDSLSPPWPDVIITCGRRAAMVAMGLRRDTKMWRCGDVEKDSLSSPRISTSSHPFFIHIQDPQVSAKQFDLVVAMEHDKITGSNVIKTRFALHTITPERLEEAKQQWTPRFADYPAPLTAVLLGGSTNKYTLTQEGMAQTVMALQRVLQNTKGAMLITPSRRTGEANVAMLRNVFAANPRVYVYDFVEENPYMGMLALADALIVTNDSVNMMSEAYATGKPLYILPLPGHSDTKPSRFAQMLIQAGIARPLSGKLEEWHYPVANDMEKLAQEIRRRIN